MAVLVQELMAMREERADLRAKIYLLEKEKLGAELSLEQQLDKETLLRTVLGTFVTCEGVFRRP